jgi:hypothetical protein
MARPKFFVQHFIACRNAAWDGPPGPNTTRTLEQVGFLYRVPPGTEAPEFEEFWLYARMFVTNGATGRRTFSVEIARTGVPEQQAFDTRSLGSVEFRNPTAAVNVAWALRPLRFPSVGDYTFRLMCEVSAVLKTEWRVVAREFIRIGS